MLIIQPEGSLEKTQYQSIFARKYDFFFSAKYEREINYLEAFYHSQFTKEVVQSDQELLEILSSNYRIFLSKYAFETLQTQFEKNKLITIQNLIFSKDVKNVILSKNLLTESYINQCYVLSDESNDFIERINSSPYIVGMLRENYNFLLKMEEIIYRKSHPEERGVEADLPHKFPIEKSSATFLSNCPDYSNKFLVDLAKSYVN